MAAFDIEGFPRHHRVLHVKQEVKSSEDTVLAVVLAADVERNELIQKEKELLDLQESLSTDSPEFATVVADLRKLYDRMSQIGSENAESRAATILNGLQFTEDMQRSPISALSGGWRMRVALAGALFIAPDVLLLDEPTNHLDLNAVIWLQDYLKSYTKTILLVSHDRAFLNEVCTDIILFKNLKLTYYRGDYDSFESTRREALLVQQRQHEAQMVKVQHMQEFVDKVITAIYDFQVPETI
jgi:ATP-binding cassette subfamily F protein 3